MNKSHSKVSERNDSILKSEVGSQNMFKNQFEYDQLKIQEEQKQKSEKYGKFFNKNYQNTNNGASYNFGGSYANGQFQQKADNSSYHKSRASKSESVFNSKLD